MDTNDASTIAVYSTPMPTELLMTCGFNAPRTLVFAAWTEAVHMPHWMLGPEGWSMEVRVNDLRPGGAWHFVWRREDGTEMEMHGEYRDVVAPERVVSIERWGGEWPETLNTSTFTEVAGRTTIALLIQYPTQQARDAVLGSGMQDGMDLSLARLERYLATF